jgi:hypothetical protein
MMAAGVDVNARGNYREGSDAVAVMVRCRDIIAALKAAAAALQ